MATLKYSRQRAAIKDFLMTRTDHPTADTVYENIRQLYPNISLGTVYRNLSLLADLGEIKKLPGLDGADRFDGRVHPHCHFICTKCRSVKDFENKNLDQMMEAASKDFHGKILSFSTSFFGYCEDCTASEAK